MEQHLSAFLASVRRTRFVDYLDPLGETAQNAFERRLSWARVSQHDPAYADEARFLLDHADFLREVLRRELEEDDWIEEADVGREWETRPSRAVRMRENDRVTEIFQADDVDLARAPQNAQQARGAARSVSRSDPPRAASRTAGGAVPRSRETQRPSPRASAAPAPSRSVAVSSPPQDTPRDGARSRDGRTSRPPDAQRSATPAGTARRAELSARTSRTPAPPRSTPGPSRSRQSTPPRSIPPVGGSRSGNSLPPIRDTPPRGSLLPSTERMSRSRAMELGRSDPGSRVRDSLPYEAPTMRAQAVFEEDDQTTPMPPSERSRTELHDPAREAVVQEVEFDDWDAPDDPVSSTGIMRIEDINPPQSQDTIIGHDSFETVVQPSPVARSSMVLDDAATRPSAATRLRTPHELDASRGGSLAPLARSSLRSTEPPRRSRWPMLVVLGMAMLVLLLVVGGSLVAIPVLYTGTDLFASLGLVVPNEPAPAPEPPPRPPEPPPAPVDVAPEGVAPPEPPAQPQPEQPEQRSKASRRDPEPPQPAISSDPPAPTSTVPPIDVTGPWIGSTSTSQALKLTVFSQDAGTFEGEIYMQLEDGTFKSFAVQGKVDGAGAISFKGNGFSFSGKVGSGGNASGTYTSPDSRPVQWTMLH